MKNKILFLFPLLLLCSCCKVSSKIEPNIIYSASDTFIKELKNPFPSLSHDEIKEDWAREYTIALGFGKKMDLYQAICTFKRAEILIPPEKENRKFEVQYFIVLCYYLGNKYPYVVEAFEASSLPNIDKSFLAFHDLLIVLYDTYTHLNETEKAESTKKVLEDSFPESAEELNISTALLDADIDKLKILAKNYDYLTPFIDSYESKKKSIKKAELLNGLLPGAGYLYLGQKKSALTAFLLNGVFIWATYEFFHKGYVPAGIIFASFEAGWYFGGIYGAGEEAKFYNERIYDSEVKPLMNTKKIYPFFMLRYAF